MNKVREDHESLLKRINEIDLEKDKILKQVNLLVGSYNAYNDALKSIKGLLEDSESNALEAKDCIDAKVEEAA